MNPAPAPNHATDEVRNSRLFEARLALTVVGFIAVAMVAALWLASPPSPVSAAAPASDFSAERAFRHVQAIAKTPRPAGTAANAAARAYIVRELEALGLPVQAVTEHSVEPHRAAEIHNILARIPGRTNTKAFALMSHHDSVRYGPGAADDGSGAAAILETARALVAGPPLSNDVLLVFTDAEETGLLGAKAFARHPWAETIGVLLGLESRGLSGGSLIFETSASNGWLIAELARAKVGAFASSLSSSIYERMPFNGDFSWLKQHGQHGFHAAFVNDFAWYHTGNDRPERLSLASLQQHGNYALGLARHFGSLPLNRVTAPDAVYFNTIGPWLAHYPKGWSAGLALAAGGLALAALVFGVWRGRLSALGLVAGAAWFAGTAVCASLVTLALLAVAMGPMDLLSIFRSRLTRLPNLRPFYQNDLYGLAFALAAFAVFAAALNLVRRGPSRRSEPNPDAEAGMAREPGHRGTGNEAGALSFAGGALIWWGILLCVLQVYLPGGSYLATWPLVFGALQLLVLLAAPCKIPAAAETPERCLAGGRSPMPIPGGGPWPALTVWLLPLTLPAIFLLVPAYRYLLSSVFIITGPALVLIVVLMAGLLIPQLDLVARAWRWSLPALAALSAIAILITGVATNRVSAAKPNFDCVAYTLDRDANQAFWVSSDAVPDEWTRQFFPPGTAQADVKDFFPGFHGRCLRAVAPAAALSGPDVRVTGDSIIDENRRLLTLRILSPDHAPNLKLRVVSDTAIYFAKIFGQQVSGAPLKWEFSISGLPPEGLEMELELPLHASPLILKVVEQHFGLPELPNVRPRPAYLLPEPNTLNHNASIGSDQMLVSRSFRF